MPEKKKQQSPGEIYDRRAMALARALEAQRDGGDPRGDNARMDDRSFALAQAARRAIAEERVRQRTLTAGERGLDRLPPYSDVHAQVLAKPRTVRQENSYGRTINWLSGYDDKDAMVSMLSAARDGKFPSAPEAMREALFRPGEGRGTVMAADLPLSGPSGDFMERDPGGRSGLIPTPPYTGDYWGSYDLESDLYGPTMGSGASAMQNIPAYEGGVSRFDPTRLPEYRQTLRQNMTDLSLGRVEPYTDEYRTAMANVRYADSPAGKRPFNPGERERLAAPQKRAAKKGK